MRWRLAQLGIWASRAAAVRAANLQLSCKLHGYSRFKNGTVELSPRGDFVALCPPSISCSALLVPTTQPKVDLGYSHLSERPPSQSLTWPGCGSDKVQGLTWSPSGQHLVLVSEEAPTPSACSLRVSTFRGTQLVGSVLEPLAGPESFACLHVSDDAATRTATTGYWPAFPKAS